MVKIDLKFSYDELKKAFEDGVLYGKDELELNTDGRNTAFEVWFETTMFNNGDSLKKLDMRSTLIKWLSDEYSLEEATEQIDKASISITGNEVTVLYNNGVYDILKFIGDTIICINPHIEKDNGNPNK